MKKYIVHLMVITGLRLPEWQELNREANKYYRLTYKG